MTQKLRKPIAFFAVFAMVMAALLVIPSFWGTASAEEKWENSAAAAYDGGTGTSGSPYLIANAEQLAYLAQQVNGGENYQGIYFKLTANIDLGGKEWTPIGDYDIDINLPFTGVFDGNNKTIDNLLINNPDTSCCGLFGCIYYGGVIKNLAVNGSVSATEMNVGGICGQNSMGTISNCSFSGSVIGQSSYVGGICGMNGNGTILNCINSAKVEGRDRVGGISESSGNSIQYCVNVGVVSGTGNNVGGVCGYYNNRSTVSDCYFDKSVNPGLSAYGNKDDEDTVKGLTTNELCGALPAKFSDSIWQEGSIDSANRKGTYISLINIGEPAEGKLPEYNFGTDDKPDMDIYTLITTPEQFKAIGESDAKWAENYVLGNDIDLGGAELTPIGNDTTHFTGKFSGNGHVVSNFVINIIDGKYAGLFGYNEGKIVKVGVEKASVNAVSYVGAICGASKGTIRDCYNTSAVSGEDNIGGICGQNLTGGTITNCYNTGNITGEDWEVGGICGHNFSTVANCYNTGAISGRSSVGGVCGTSSESTTNCYNTGAVSGDEEVGGVCGFNGSLMENCYNTGTVNGTKKVGGVCGTNTDTTTNCYYNKDVFSGNGSNSGEGGGTDTTIGLTTEELCDSKNTSFDYTNTWVEGSCIFESEESKPNFRTAKYTFPSLNGVGEAYTINKIEQYNFGTDDEPDWDVYTLITKPDDFKAIGDSGTDWDKNYVLGNDIVFADGTELTPIGNDTTHFTGKFSGNGHIVSNFVINKSDANDNYVGLFGYNEGKIVKVGVEKANVTGTMNAGGVCGQNIGTIRNCYNAATVSGGYQIGGVCGINNTAGTITNCYNTGEVSGTNYNTGGVCGLNLSTVTNCYNTGNVNGKTNVGGVCGANSGTITNCYYSTDTFSGNGIGTDTSTGSATGLTTEKLCDKENTQSFDYENIWEPGRCDITPGMSSKFRTVTYVLPSLKGVGEAKKISDVKQYDFGYDNNTDWDIYTLITTTDNFKAIGDSGTGWDKNYVLGADIPFEGDQLTPIGNSSIAFKGKFSGDGHIISGFIINSPTSNSVGLFGSNLGLIENVGIKNAQVTGKSSVGGVCGQNNNNIKSSGIIKNCYNAGIVSGGNYIGGVCGENNGTVANCYNTNKVSGDSSIGGVCGMNRGTITNCYNTSDVSAADKWVGGMCGANGKNIENCYSTGAVSGTDAVGGVCGLNNGPMKNCYYNKDVCTNGNDSATGLTTIQMTDGNALTTMGFGADWSKKDIDKENGIAYYPDLAVFADDKPSVKYETKLVIEPSDKNAEYKYGDEVKFNVSALVKFDGAADFAADTTAATESKGSFTVTVDGEPVVDSTDIFDNTTAEAVIPSIKITGDKKTFTLVYDGTNSAYIKSGTATCKVSIAKLDLTADDFTFTVPTKLIYDGTAKEATVTVNDGITGVGIITVKYYMGDVETQPINAGDYTVKIDVAGNNIYNSAHDLTADGWKFTIAKAAQNIDAPAEYALTYGETGKITATTDGDGAISYAVTAGSDVIGVAADGAVTVLKAGTATVEITAAETANYAPATKTVNVTVSKVAVTIIANSYTIKVGDNLPAYDYEVTGLVNGDALPIDVTISCAADGKTAGEFPITVSGAADSANYTFSYTNGTLIVSNKETQTITADDVTLTYGETAKITASTNGDGAISYAVTAGSDVISVAADGTITALKAGTATVEITAAETDTYAKAVKAVTVTVNKAAVKITAKNYTIKVGDNLPAYDYEVTGLVNGDALPIDVTISCAADGKTAGEFPITVSGAAESTNYTFSYTNGMLTVNNKETQTITADDVTLTYGETAKITASTDGDGAISYSVKTGDDVISVAADGTITALKAGTATVEITAAETDTYAKAVKAVTVTVNKAAVTITAKNYAIKVGDNLPAYDYEVTVLVNGEALPIEVTTSCAADGKTAGEFPITVSGAAESTNYTFSYTNGTLTVNNKETQTITADDVTLTYGETAKITASTDGDGAISYSVKTGDDVISVAADGAITALKAGTATVEITAAETDTYAKAVKAVTVTVNKADVTITAKDYAIKVGDNLPAYDYEVTGLVNGETLPIDVTISCAADGKTAGEFPITVSGAAESASYTFTYTNGTLTVNSKETQTVTANDVTLTYGETAKITATTDGDGAISCAVTAGSDVISVAADGAITALKAGTATVEITAAETDTYAKAVKAVTVTVNKAAVTIKAKNYTIKKGGALPAFEYTVTGLVNGDTLAFAPALTCAANTNTVGTYDIIVAIEITEDERYTYATQNGTLTVENKSSGGSTGGTGGSGGRPALPSNSSDSANPAINGTSKNWKNITIDISNSAWNSSIIIQLNGNTTVPAEVIKTIADRDSSVLFVDSVFSWVVDGAKITEPVSADLTLIRTASIKSDGLRGTEGVQFRINSTGIPTDLEIAFRAEHAGKFANLFRNENGKLTFVTCAKIGADGKALLPEVTEAGNYIVMLGEFSDRPGDVNNDGVLNALDASAVLKEVVGLEAVANPIVADFNSNGTINALDASEILKKVVGLI